MDHERIEAARVVARAWSDHGIPFLVMHGLEGYPDQIGRDLDILMSPRLASSALDRASNLLSGLGWKVAFPPPLWGQRLVAVKGHTEGTQHYLELHTMASLRWAALTLVDLEEQSDGTIGAFPYSSWATFAKTVLTPLLGRDVARFDSRYLAGLADFGITEDFMSERASRLFGEDLARRLASAIADADLEELGRLTTPLRNTAIRHMFSHPLSSVRTAPKFLIQKFGRMGSSSGMRATLTAPSRQDPYQVAEEVIDKVRHLFVTTELSRTRSLRGRFGEQYRTLSRQGLVLDVDSEPSGSEWTLSILPLSLLGFIRDPEEVVSFEPGRRHELTDEIAGYLVDRWLSEFAREGSGRYKPASTTDPVVESGETER
jgi:hypothetical protein